MWNILPNLLLYENNNNDSHDDDNAADDNNINNNNNDNNNFSPCRLNLSFLYLFQCPKLLHKGF